VLVKKPNHTWRVCIDYRELNKLTRSMGCLFLISNNYSLE
jgi:hypothetical protein